MEKKRLCCVCDGEEIKGKGLQPMVEWFEEDGGMPLCQNCGRLLALMRDKKER